MADPRHSVPEDAAHLSAFCASRPDTAHLAQCFANLACGQQDLSARSKNRCTAKHSSGSSQLSSEGVAIMHDDGGTEVDGQAVNEAGDQGGQNEPALQRHQPKLVEAMEELTEKFQMMLHLPSAQVWTSRCSADTCLAACAKRLAHPRCSCGLHAAKASEDTRVASKIVLDRVDLEL